MYVCPLNRDIYIYIYFTELPPFLCAAFSLSSISWAPTQLILFPQKMLELGSGGYMHEYKVTHIIS